MEGVGRKIFPEGEVPVKNIRITFVEEIRIIF